MDARRNAWMYVHVRICTYMQAQSSTGTCMHVYEYVCRYVHMKSDMRMHTDTWMHAWMHACMYVRIYV